MTDLVPGGIIPDEALDDRLGFMGTAGSGKTYNAAGRVERLLDKGARVIVVDPLDVWWGLRLRAGGTQASRYRPVIIGGAHGDLPLNEHSGGLIGETVARARESFIVSLATLPTRAAERRFMLAFLTGLHRRTDGEPLHVIFDEADLWAPQMLRDKEGDAAKLYGQMETIVRRGRIRGFIPWLITQRPAVVAKDVLSQIDGLVAFKLTSTQDRDAIGDWVKGQADVAQWNAIWKALPTLLPGHGVVWIPARGILAAVAFPPKNTFDSSATPKRGDRRQNTELKPLNVDALRSRLEEVAREAEANDPRRLKSRIAELEKQLLARGDAAANQMAVKEAEQRGYERGRGDERALFNKLFPAITAAEGALKGLRDAWPDERLRPTLPSAPAMQDRQLPPGATRPHEPLTAGSREHVALRRALGSDTEHLPDYDAALPSGAEKMLETLATGLSLTWTQVATMTQRKARGGHFNTCRKALVQGGWVREDGGTVSATAAGIDRVGGKKPVGLTYDFWRSALPPAPARVLTELYGLGPNEITKSELAARLNLKPTGGHWNTTLAILRQNDLIEDRGDKVQASASLWTNHG